jgi:hypothetical protein
LAEAPGAGVAGLTCSKRYWYGQVREEERREHRARDEGREERREHRDEDDFIVLSLGMPTRAGGAG